MLKNNLLIGLEIHGYLQTNEKLFCRCKVAHKEKTSKPNTSICPICCGYPGAKPMLPNKQAIKKIIQIGLMLGCKINSEPIKVIWQRKHYDWPDLPKGYQDTISGAYSVPVGENGKFFGIRIREIHLEEDPAAWNPQTGSLDYNRSGLPLVEIVTEPDFTSSEQVVHWLRQLILTLSYIKAVNKDAGIKADVNVSTFGERVEIKNVNSIENIKKAIEYEAQRQHKEKRKIERETRRFDEKKAITIRMRRKEEAEDYRFIPDPDLPVIKIKNQLIKKIKNQLPESPQEKLKKLIKKYKIDKKSAQVLYSDLEIAEFFEAIVKKIEPKFALPWVTIELFRVLNWNKKTLSEVDIKPEHFIELLQLVKQKKITELKAKRMLNEFIPKSFSPKQKLRGQERITNKKEIEKICKQAIQKNKQAVSDFKSGKKQAFNFLLGEIMKISNRRADYKIARDVMGKLLG